MFQTQTFKNGIQLLTVPMESVDSVTVIVFVKTGGRYEKKKVSGISHVIEHALFKGTQKRPTMREISESIEKVGGSHNAATGHEFTFFYIKVPKEKIEIAFDVLSDVLFGATFEKDGIEKEKQVIIEEINVYEDIPMEKVFTHFMELLWPNQALGRELTGTKKSVKGISRQDILNYQGEYYHSNNMLIAVAGKYTKGIPEKFTREYFNYPQGKNIPNFKRAKNNQKKPQVKIVYKKSDQTHLVLGVRSYSLDHPDRFILEVLNTILGQGASSRFFESLREKEGLCYYVSSSFEGFSDTGFWYLRAGVDHSRVEKAIEISLQELNLIKKEFVLKDELSKAKEYLKGRLKLSLETSDAQASFYGMQKLLLSSVLTPNETYEKIEAVTALDIKRVASDIFVDEKLNLALIGPFKSSVMFQKILTFCNKRSKL